MTAAGASLPIVLVPLGADEDALDACLGALDAGTPAGTRVWLADDAQSGPRAAAIVERWLEHTRLQAACTRRGSAIGEAAHIDEAMRACGDADVVVLAADARPAPGWLEQLDACLRHDPAIATVTPWSNAGESASWPRIGELAELAHLSPTLLADACRRMPATHPELPAAVPHAVLLRGAARGPAGNLDAASFHSWQAALIDLSLRLAGHGWRNTLCERTFVLRGRESAPADGDMDALTVRWPAWHARLARFLMDDPLHGLRERLGTEVARLRQLPPQPDLFA